MHSYSSWLSQQRAIFKKELISAAIFPSNCMKRQGMDTQTSWRGHPEGPDYFIWHGQAHSLIGVWNCKRKWHNQERWIHEYTAIWTTEALRWHSFVKDKDHVCPLLWNWLPAIQTILCGRPDCQPRLWRDVAWTSLGKIKLTWLSSASPSLSKCLPKNYLLTFSQLKNKTLRYAGSSLQRTPKKFNTSFNVTESRHIMGDITYLIREENYFSRHWNIEWRTKYVPFNQGPGHRYGLNSITTHSQERKWVVIEFYQYSFCNSFDHAKLVYSYSYNYNIIILSNLEINKVGKVLLYGKSLQRDLVSLLPGPTGLSLKI